MINFQTIVHHKRELIPIRTLSMTFGRPSALPDSYVRLGLPSDGIAICASPKSDPETISISLALFNSTMSVLSFQPYPLDTSHADIYVYRTLYKQTWNVIDVLYGQNL